MSIMCTVELGNCIVGSLAKNPCSWAIGESCQ